MHDDLDAMALEINGVMHMFSEKDTAGLLYDILFEKVGSWGMMVGKKIHQHQCLC